MTKLDLKQSEKKIESICFLVVCFVCVINIGNRDPIDFRSNDFRDVLARLTNPFQVNIALMYKQRVRPYLSKFSIVDHG